MANNSVVAVRILPMEFEQQIGKLIFNYAYAEKQCLRLVYMLSGIDWQTGELMARGARLNETLETIQHLCDHKSIPYDKQEIKDLQKQASKIKEFRDLVAHSNWIKEGDTYSILKLRGNWGDQLVKQGKAAHKSKSVAPEARPIKSHVLWQYNTALTHFIRQIDDLCEALTSP